MKDLQYPFDNSYILKKRKSIKRCILADFDYGKAINKKIAILGGSTTHDIRDILELFLLDIGIQPEFYESEYAQWQNDVIFDNEALCSFKPDIIFIHTSSRNVLRFPTVRDSNDAINLMIDDVFDDWRRVWDKITKKFNCPIVQNNFELPFFRLLGNRDAWDIHGRTNFITRLNQKFYEYACEHENFYINDILFLQASYGIEKWSSPEWWYLYKCALNLDAIPELAFNLANIIKSIYGKNKKAFVLDLDNTLWGGVVGDDGVENIEIGQETSNAQLFAEFQTYLKAHKDIGVLLNINSKNEEKNALSGLNRPDSVLHPNDFISIKANWKNKDENFSEIASELNLGTDSLVFVDDNPAEREIVRQKFPSSAVPEISNPESYIKILDRSGFFEVTIFSIDDARRNEMYKANIERAKCEKKFSNYREYLLSLNMKAEVKSFEPIFMSRIAQLTNKSNQFNLTTLRCTQADVENFASDKNYITLYGRLFDKFGDNGVVSVVFGHIDSKNGDFFHIDLWLMSCRVLKRDMELAMLDELVSRAKCCGVKKLFGYYHPTGKNAIVKDFYAIHGFEKVSEDSAGNTKWSMDISGDWKNINNVITVLN